ncbi:hypothetical protein IG631_24200 [Alternaria alternata]|nr:hypothetical protein IG631_24200 [Alternaria alternata]
MFVCCGVWGPAPKPASQNTRSPLERHFTSLKHVLADLCYDGYIDTLTSEPRYSHRALALHLELLRYPLIIALFCLLLFVLHPHQAFFFTCGVCLLLSSLLTRVVTLGYHPVFPSSRLGPYYGDVD